MHHFFCLAEKFCSDFLSNDRHLLQDASFYNVLPVPFDGPFVNLSIPGSTCNREIVKIVVIKYRLRPFPSFFFLIPSSFPSGANFQYCVRRSFEKLKAARGDNDNRRLEPASKEKGEKEKESQSFSLKNKRGFEISLAPLQAPRIL